MSTTPCVIDVSTAIIIPGDSWAGNHPSSDIVSLEFRCWTAQGQLVEARPNGNVYYMHHGLPYIFPINVLYTTSLPVFWKDQKTPFLGCPQDLYPQFGTPNIEVTPENAYPNNKVVQTMGPPLDVFIHPASPTTVHQAPADIVKRKIKAKAKDKDNLTPKAVNAFIAYRCLYSPLIPLGTQMEISGVIRDMWHTETPSSKQKFSLAAKIYTLERDYAESLGFPKLPLKNYMKVNFQRFQVSPPVRHIVEQIVYCVGDERVANLREIFESGNESDIDEEKLSDPNFVLTERQMMLLNFNYAIEARDRDFEELGPEVTVFRYYINNPHFAPFDPELAIAEGHLPDGFSTAN